MEATKSKYAIHVLDWIFRKPIFLSADFIAASGIPRTTAKRILREVCARGLLTELRPSEGRRSGIYSFSALLKIVG